MLQMQLLSLLLLCKGDGSLTPQAAQRQLRRKNMMLDEPIYKLIPKMALPTIVAFLINSIYNMADTYFVSSLGTAASAAVGVNSSLDQMIMMAGSFLAVGSNSYIARLLGAKQEEKASSVLSTAFLTAFGFGAVVMVLGLAFIRPMVRMLGATPTVEEYAIQYAGYVLYVAPFMACNFVMNQCLRAEGSAMLSMVGMGLGGIINVFLDPIFIFQLDLGVAGASMATAISKMISFFILIFPYLTKRSLLRLSIRRIQYTWDTVKQVAMVGSSSLFRTGTGVLSGILINNIAGGFSDSVLAAISVTTRVMMFPFSFILGFCQGFQPVAGFNWGAKRYDRVQASYRFSTRTVIISSCIIGLALGIFSDQAIRLFSETDQQMLEIGSLCIRLQCFALPIQGWVCANNMLHAGLGKAGGALALSTARQGYCFLPLVFLLPALFGEVGIASVQAAADLLSLAVAIPLAVKISKEIRERIKTQDLNAVSHAVQPAEEQLCLD